MINWKDIHPDFEGYLGEEKKAKWQEVSFDAQQTKEWIDIGLKVGEPEIAAYARWKGYQSSSVNVVELRKEYYQAQNWLDYYYLPEGRIKLNPNEREGRNKIKSLNVSNKSLEGSLNLKGFINLEKLYCYDNRLINLDLSSCPNLKVLSCARNEFNYLDLTGSGQLEKLDCEDNSFSEQDLSFLNHLVNLKDLSIANREEERIKKGLYNRFFGSLKPLQNLTSLESLDISNTDINLGWEYLPESLKEIYYEGKERPGAKINEVKEELDSYLTKKWLDKNFPEEKRVKIKELKVQGYENLKGHLDLSDFVNLEMLDFSSNKITNLNLSNCENLQLLNASFNQLSNVDFLNDLPNPKRLKSLHLYGNDIYSDLFPFSWFTNLEELNLGNYDSSGDLSEKERFNKFYGSLKPLKNLSKLKILNISNTDIDSGFHYLPASLEEIYCSNKERPKSRVRIISQLLKKDSNFTFQSEKYVKKLTFWDAQEWLDENYPKEQRSKTKTLDISNKNLKNSLNLGDFTNLENLECYNNQLTSLVISECLKLKELNCYKNKLASLDVSKNTQLAKLVCSGNQILNLLFSKENQIIELYCLDNLLTELDFSSLNDELEVLDISANNFPEQELSFLGKFFNLKVLRIGTHDEERIQRDIYNRFTGSLEPLKNMSKLEELSISNTDIDEGVDYLPTNIKQIFCLTAARQGWKLKKVVEALENKEQLFQSLILVKEDF